MMITVAYLDRITSEANRAAWRNPSSAIGYEMRLQGKLLHDISSMLMKNRLYVENSATRKLCEIISLQQLLERLDKMNCSIRYT